MSYVVESPSPLTCQGRKICLVLAKDSEHKKHFVSIITILTNHINKHVLHLHSYGTDSLIEMHFNTDAFKNQPLGVGMGQDSAFKSMHVLH